MGVEAADLAHAWNPLFATKAENIFHHDMVLPTSGATLVAEAVAAGATAVIHTHRGRLITVGFEVVSTLNTPPLSWGVGYVFYEV